MDRQYIRDHAVIERYLRGALTADEEAAFEEAYLGDDELLDELESAEQLRRGLQELGAAGALNGRASSGGWPRFLASPQYAAAASVLLAVSIVISGALYRQNQSLRALEFPAAGQVTRVVPLVAVRGTSSLEVTAPAANELTVLHLDPGFMEHDAYRVTLERRAGAVSEELWSRSGLTRDELAVALPPSALPPGEYEARLEGRMDAWQDERFEEVGRMMFTVVAAE